MRMDGILEFLGSYDGGNLVNLLKFKPDKAF